MAHIILNGEQKEIEDNMTLEELLLDMKLPKFYVVEKNMQIVYREDFASEILKDNDNIEIATFCGGG